MIFRMTETTGKTLKEYSRNFNLESQKLLFRGKYFKEIEPGVYMGLSGGERLLKRMEGFVAELLTELGYEKISIPFFPSKADSSLKIMSEVLEGEMNSYKDFPAGFYFDHTKLYPEHKASGGLFAGRYAPGLRICRFNDTMEANEEGWENFLAKLVKRLELLGIEAEIVRTAGTHYSPGLSSILWVKQDRGETGVFRCEGCGYLAADRVAEKALPESAETGEAVLGFLYTPEIKTIRELAEFTGTEDSKLAKTLLVTTGGVHYALVMRGDRELNPYKLSKILKVHVGDIQMADEEKIENEIDSQAGFIGPMGLKNIKILADAEIPLAGFMIAGSNKKNYHVENVLYGRDYRADRVEDLVYAKSGDACPHCGKPMNLEKGFVLGDFKNYGNSFAESVGLAFLDREGKKAFFHSFSAFINLYAMAGLVCENSQVQTGLCWPPEVAPYDIHVLILNAGKEEQADLGMKVSKALSEAGWHILLDDRKERAGFKFKDSELLGIPKVLVVGNKAAEGVLEYRNRRTGFGAEFEARAFLGLPDLP